MSGRPRVDPLAFSPPRRRFRTSPMPSSARGWRASGPCLASSLASAVSYVAHAFIGPWVARFWTLPGLSSNRGSRFASTAASDGAPSGLSPVHGFFLPGTRLLPPEDFVPAAAVPSPAAGQRSSLLGTTGIFTPVPTSQHSGPVFYGWRRFSSFATTPTAAPLRRLVPCPGPRLRPRPPRPLWCFLPDARIVPCLNSGGACVVITDSYTGVT